MSKQYQKQKLKWFKEGFDYALRQIEIYLKGQQDEEKRFAETLKKIVDTYKQLDDVNKETFIDEINRIENANK